MVGRSSLRRRRACAPTLGTHPRQGIRINTVCPGWIDTPLVARAAAQLPGLDERITSAEPIGRIGRREGVAAAVLWLCSEAASFVTGSCLAVDGGSWSEVRPGSGVIGRRAMGDARRRFSP